MAFARIQGKKMAILHNFRKNGSIKQEVLHVFQTFSAARQAVSDDQKWRLFCDSLDMKLNGAARTNRTQLKKKIQKLLETVDINSHNPLQDAAVELISGLSALTHPLHPNQIRHLTAAESSLKTAASLIEEKLALLETVRTDDMPALDTQDPLPSSVALSDKDLEELYDEALELFNTGKWETAKAAFLALLKIEPTHINALYYTGALESMMDNHQFALSYYGKAATIGKERIDAAIAHDPDWLVKQVDIDREKANRVCDYIAECPDWNTAACNDCEHNPLYEIANLYSHWKFRPFFNSLIGKAVTLMTLKKYDQAIDTLKLCNEYQPLWGNYNMLGLCYFHLGDMDTADATYNEMLWADACYVKALIKYIRGDMQAAMRYLLRGVFWNPHIAYMLIGQEKPEKVRYVGSLPDRLQASEFMHDDGHIFRHHSGFRTLVRCIADDDTISGLLSDISSDRQKRDADPSYRWDRDLFSLSSGDISPAFYDTHLPRLFRKLTDPASEYWQPERDEQIRVTILEQNRQNWRLCLTDSPEKVFYFRPSGSMAGIEENDDIDIRVVKSWFYRKRLFVSGTPAR